MGVDWFFSIGGRQAEGPVLATQLEEMASTGRLQPTDLVWQAGTADWVPAGTVQHLFPPTEARKAVAKAVRKPTSAASAVRVDGDRVTCPHCWHSFELHRFLWVSTHPSLRGDPRLADPRAQRRFLPSRFTPRGAALDEAGGECTQLACPNCHLMVPRAFTERSPWFVSLIGAPGVGKSFLLGAMIHVLRRRLPSDFGVTLTDTEASFNTRIASYEDALFRCPTPEHPRLLGSLIEKTQERGDDYDTVLVGGHPVQHPRPFLFTVRPKNDRPSAPSDPGEEGRSSRILCLYDNAGESFQTGRDSTANPVTRHLAESGLLLFLFDPTQHPAFAARIAARGPVRTAARRTDSSSQHLILSEAADRIRRFANLPDSARYAKPLIVVVSKLDLWRHLVPGLATLDVVATTASGRSVLDLDAIQNDSRAIRTLLTEVVREVVETAESFASSVTYIGVSALGTHPAWDAEQGDWAIRPGDIRPIGVELPLLYGLNRVSPQLIPGGRKRRSS